MTRGRAIAVGLLAAGLGLASCGGETQVRREGGAGAGGAGSGPAIEQIPALFSGVACEILPSCAGDLFTELFLGGADCATQMEREFRDKDFAPVLAAVDAGRVDYHPEHVDACIDAIRDLGCGLFVSWYLPECEAALSGTVAEGGECTDDDECEGDLFCRIEGGCPGSCTPRLAVGGQCQDDSHCELGLVCTEPPEGESRGRCAVPAAPGEACDEQSAPCSMGLLCFPDSAGETTCTALGDVFSEPEGAECGLAVLRFCQQGLVCVTERVSVVTEPTSTCAEPGASSGGSCRAAVPDECPEGEYCDGLDLAQGDYEGTCEALPIDGEPCAPTVLGDEGQCAVYHACINGTCREMRRLGEPCVHDEQCYSDRCSGGSCAEPDPCSE